MKGAAFAAEISEDRSVCSVAAAWREPGGKVAAEIAFYGPKFEAVSRLAGMWARWEPVAVVVDNRAQSATLIKPLLEAGIVTVQPSTQEVAVAHGEFMDLVTGGELRHMDQPELTAAVRGALERPLAGAKAWERRVPVDQSPLVSATFAVWAFLKWEKAGQPSAWLV